MGSRLMMDGRSIMYMRKRASRWRGSDLALYCTVCTRAHGDPETGSFCHPSPPTRKANIGHTLQQQLSIDKWMI